MEKNIVKIDDNNVAVVGEARAIHERGRLIEQKAKLQQRIAEIDELLAVFE